MKLNTRHLHSRKVPPPIYLLPNMLTMGSMFCGFYAIIQSINANFIAAGIAIFFAMILDGLDGRIARLTHTASPFGAELDSLSDMVNFGVAPAIIIFNWQLHLLGKMGWLFVFVYCACTALRLARFNTMIGIIDRKFFLGLPCPTAAALTVGFVYTCNTYKIIPPSFLALIAAIITLVAAFSMVSTIKFYSFKELNFHHKARFRTLLTFFMGLVLLIIHPDLMIYGFFVIYTLSGYCMCLFRIKYLTPKKYKQNPEI